ncbi:RICIN domain-containing protein [Streptomyces erythrochromogenes]|uniref:RICIN domain-containing protein n=1 Tax=Streptomyces erythrochromogenes TaxID=285574 RepID=UPI003803C7B3
MARAGRPQGAMKGATGAADELARFLVELTAGLTVREMARRYGGGKTSWGEYRSGVRIIPRGLLNEVVRDRVRDGRGRTALLRRAGRLHDAALVAGAEAGPPPRLDEALRRAEADLAESERIVRQLATLIAALLAEQEGAPSEAQGQAHGQPQGQAQAPPAEPWPTPAASRPAAGPTAGPWAGPGAGAAGGGLLDRAAEQLAAVWAVRASALRIASLRGTAARTVPSASERRALPAGSGGLALELARTTDVLEYARWEVERLEHDVEGERRAYGGPIEGVVLERTDRPTAVPVGALPARSGGPLTVVLPPPATRAASGRTALVAAAVLGVVTIAVVVLAVLGGRQPLVVPVGAGPVQPYPPTAGGAQAGSGTPSAGPSGSAPATTTAAAPSGRAPLPTPPAPTPVSPSVPSPGAVGPVPPAPSASQAPPAGAEPTVPAAGLVRLANTGSRRCLSVPQDSTLPADPLRLADCGERHEQLWHLTKESDGPAGTVYSIRNRFSGLCLSVDAARVTNDAAVTQYLCGDRQGLFPDQLWTMRFHAASAAWQLVNVNSGKCVAARVGGGTSDPAFQQDCREDPWLTWRL